MLSGNSASGSNGNSSEKVGFTLLVGIVVGSILFVRGVTLVAASHVISVAV